MVLSDESGSSPCAVWLFVHVFGPMLCEVLRDNERAGAGCAGACVAVCLGRRCLCARVHTRCPARMLGYKADAQRVHRCDFCAPLFPTRPLKGKNKFSLGVLSTSTVGEALRRVAVEVGVSGLKLSAKSLRIGGLSAASSEADGPGIAVVSNHMRWSSAKVPMAVYKRETPEEQQRTGAALHKVLRTHAHTPAGGGAGVTVKTESFQGGGEGGTGLTAGTHVHCLCCGGPFPAEPCVKHEGRQKQFCETCWASRLEKCRALLGKGGLSAAQPVREAGEPWVGFPMTWTMVQSAGGGTVEVCLPFQFGQCRMGPSCRKAHVCSAHGVAHGVCAELRARVALWQAGR